MDIETYALAKAYTDKEVIGGGAIKGKNCVITEIEEITGGHIVHFQWTLDDGTVETDTMIVMDGVDGTQVSASETNGNIVIDGVETQVYDDSEIREIIDTTPETIEGNPLNFSTLSAQNAESTIIDLEPIQDLHGYDYPWVGGAGKNICPLTVANIKASGQHEWTENSRIINNVTFTILTDSDDNVLGIKVNGTASAKISNFTICNINHILVSGTVYRVSGCPSGGSVSGYNILIWDSGAGGGNDTGNGFSFTPRGGTLYFRIDIESGTVCTNLIFKPMICLSTATDSDYAHFEPYTNICPITGRTQVGIEGCGKNLLTEISGGAYNSDGSDFPANNRCKTPIFKIDTDTNYTLTGATTQSKTLQGRIQKWKNNSYTENVLLGETDWANLPISYTNSADSYISIAFRYSSNDNISYTDLTAQLELGSTATSYEPYTQSNNLTISFGETVYGGQVDVERGKVIVDKKIRELTSSDTWYHDERWDNCFHTVWTNDGITPTTYGIEAISSQYTNVIKSVTSLNNGEFIYNTAFISSGSGSFIVKNEKYSTANDFKDSLVNNPIQLCYELGTPITINLTPNTINLLKGVNNISTDGDKITLTYRDGSVATLGDLTSAVDSLDGKIEDSKILTDTETGTKYRLVVTDGVLGIEEVTEPNALSTSPLSLSNSSVETSEESSEESNE